MKVISKGYVKELGVMATSEEKRCNAVMREEEFIFTLLCCTFVCWCSFKIFPTEFLNQCQMVKKSSHLGADLALKVLDRSSEMAHMINMCAANPHDQSERKEPTPQVVL